MRLKLWGTDVPQCVLGLMCKTIQNFPEAAQTMLKANDADQFPYSDKTVDGSGPYLYKQGRFSDAYLLFEMLQIPSLFMEVCLVRVVISCFGIGTIWYNSVPLVSELA